MFEHSIFENLCRSFGLEIFESETWSCFSVVCSKMRIKDPEIVTHEKLYSKELKKGSQYFWVSSPRSSFTFFFFFIFLFGFFVPFDSQTLS